MVTEILLAALLAMATLFYYNLVVKPKKMMAYYRNIFAPSFKVYEYPFAALQAPQFKTMLQDEQKHQDCCHLMKEVISDFDISIANVAGKVQLHYISPKLMKAFHELDEDTHYSKYEMVISGLRRMVGTGLTFSEGNLWKMKRRVVTKMLNFKYIKTLVPKIKVIVVDKIGQIMTKSVQNSNDPIKFDALELTTRVASSVVLELFFGGGSNNLKDLRIDGMEVHEHIRQLMDLLVKQLQNPLVILFGKKYSELGVTKLDKNVNKMLRGYNSFTKIFVQKRLEQEKERFKTIDSKTYNPEHYVDLIEAYYVEQILKKDQPINPDFVQYIIDDFATLFSAGTDTTSHGMHMAIYYVYSHPQVLEKLRKEIKQNIPDLNNMTFESFRNCHYLEAVITETLRMHTIGNGGFPREAKIDHEMVVGDLRVPIKKGTLACTQTYTTHYKESIYKNQNTFDPSRFLNQEGNLVYPEPFTFMSFSAGTRSCVGRQLAMTEMKTFLAILVNDYDVNVTDKKEKKMAFTSFAITLENVDFRISPISK